jgi:hypothetical protein
MQPLSSKAILSAVGELLAEERAQRIALEARIDEYGNLVRVPGPQGERGMPGEPGRDGVPGERGMDGPAGPAGERGMVGERGAMGDPGRDGRDGRPGETGERGMDGPAGPVGAMGERGPSGEPAYPGRACGLYSATETYRAMDVVSYNGSEWRAVRDDPGELPGDGWMLGAKGSRGKPGERGERGMAGPQGPQGPAGNGLADIVVENGVLVFLMTDGRHRQFSLEDLS